MRFHEMQKAILSFRDERVKRLKVMYPHVTRKAPAAKKGMMMRSFGGSVASSRRSRKSAKVSPEVAPPTMFQKDKGLTNNSISTHTNHLLSTRAYKICNIDEGNSFELTANVRLIRENAPHRQVGDPWTTLSKRPAQEQARLKMFSTLRDHRRSLEPARPWEPTRAV